MKGFHYNDYGVRILAKEMKKSLYSSANKADGKPTALQILSGHKKVTKKTNPPIMDPFEKELRKQLTPILMARRKEKNSESIDCEIVEIPNTEPHTPSPAPCTSAFDAPCEKSFGIPCEEPFPPFPLH